MCENKTQLSYVKDLQSLTKMFGDPSLQSTDLFLPSEKTAAVQWKLKKNFVPQSDKTNVFLACFTTAWARLKLYEVLEQLDRRVLYFDTDSIIYVNQPGQNPPYGDHLGELVDELEGKLIKTFVSGGPKNYAYHRSDGVAVCKIRGFTLNYINSQALNFDTVKTLVTSQDPEAHIPTFNPAKITRDAKRRKILNRPEEKIYRQVYDK